jgi:hypothetical protein
MLKHMGIVVIVLGMCCAYGSADDVHTGDTHQQHVQADVKIINPPQKDFYDKAAFWISAALTGIGIAGIIVGIRTLFYLRKQAGEMRLQRKAMVLTLNEIKKQAELMKAQTKAACDRERARLSIYEVDPPHIALNSDLVKPDIPLRVSLTIVNDGNSIAFNVRAKGHTSIRRIVTEHELNAIEDDPNDWYELAIPSTIRATGSASKTIINVTHMAGVMDELFEAIDEATAKSLKNGHASLIIGGEITYEDLFGEEHKTPFFFLWVNSGEVGAGAWRLSSGWLDLNRQKNITTAISTLENA